MHAPLLYHFPKVQNFDAIPPDFRDRFTYRLAKPSRAGGHPKGPSGSGGLLACPISDCGHIGYFPERQVWDQVAENVWIGVDQDFQPDQFRTQEALTWYYPVTMGDGRQWFIPILNPRSPQFSLPCCDKLLMGEWQRVTKPRYADLVQHCEQLIGHITEAVAQQDDTGMTLDDDICRPIIATAIAHYYNLTLAELSTIGIFSPEVYMGAIAAIIDLEQVMAALKGARQEVSGELNPTDGVDASSLIDFGESEAAPSPVPTPHLSSMTT